MIGHVRIYGPVEQTAGLLNLKLLLMAAWMSERGNISRRFWTGSAASLSDRRFTIMYLQIKFPICENKMMDPGVVLCENECAVTCLVNRFSAIKLQTLVIWSWTPWSTNHLQLTWCRLESVGVKSERIVETNCCPSCFYDTLFIQQNLFSQETSALWQNITADTDTVHRFIWLHFEKHGLHKVGHLLRNGDRTDCQFGGDLTSAWRCVTVDCWVKHLWYYIQTTKPNRKVSLVSNVLPSVSVRLL